MIPSKKRILPSLILLLTIALIGVVGYCILEGWSVLDSIYMVIITLFTVGFKEVQPLTPGGRLFTIFITVGGVGAALYVATRIIEFIVEGEILGYRRKIKMEHKIQEMKNHYIICGFGRTGHQVAAEFDASKVPYVVIDKKNETEEELEPRGIPYIIGDITSDVRLREAGIKKANGIISAADSNVDNVYVTLSARALNPKLYIVARASDMEAEKKLKMAGANRVISPYFISGKRMAAWATKPVTSDFLDMVMHGGSLEFSLSEISVFDDCALIGKSIAEADIRQKSGALVLAVRKKDNTFNLQPSASTVIEQGDILVVVGTQEQINLLEQMTN